MEPRGRTSVEQFSTILEFMERYGDIARPQLGVQGRIVADRLWQELATTLNSVKGGIHKTQEKWRKVWADWKSKTKKKAMTIRNGTGGGTRTQLSLTTFEERLLEVMGAAVEGRRNIEEQAMNNSSQAISLSDTEDENDTGSASLTWSPSPELPPQAHPPSTIHELAQPSASREQFQASTTPTRPRLTRRLQQPSPHFSATSPHRIAMKGRRRRALASFDRATSKFVAIEQRRLALEELQESNNSRRIEAEVQRNNVLSRFADLAETWLHHYLARDNTERLNNSK